MHHDDDSDNRGAISDSMRLWRSGTLGMATLLWLVVHVFLTTRYIKRADVLDENNRPALNPLQHQLMKQSLTNITQNSKLPIWKDVTDLYGSEPIIFGKETCQTFRDTIPHSERLLGVAGMFNAGTNLLADYLRSSCRIPGAKGVYRGILWQVRLTPDPCIRLSTLNLPHNLSHSANERFLGGSIWSQIKSGITLLMGIIKGTKHQHYQQSLSEIHITGCSQCVVILTC